MRACSTAVEPEMLLWCILYALVLGFLGFGGLAQPQLAGFPGC
jgi:hypothetical protein